MQLYFLYIIFASLSQNTIFIIMINKYLNPRNDIAFRHIFGQPKNEDILISLLNSVLKEELHNRITKVSFEPTIQGPAFFGKTEQIY